MTSQRPCEYPTSSNNTGQSRLQRPLSPSPLGRTPPVNASSDDTPPAPWERSYPPPIKPESPRLYHQMQFHIVRSLFIRTYDLPPSFDFAKYLRRCMSKHITEQLDIKETSWFILVLLLLINVVRVQIEATYGGRVVRRHHPVALPRRSLLPPSLCPLSRSFILRRPNEL